MKRDKIPFELQRLFADRALEPIKSLVQSGVVNDEEALALVVQASGNFRPENMSPNYRLFKENSTELFKDEENFPASYETDLDAYRYRAASENDSLLLFKLYEHMKGKDFKNPLELKAGMQQLLANKSILELGCGPGFLVKALQNLGAKTVGVELRENYKGKISGIDIRYGNAVNLDKLCENESFDAIISNDFFATACVNRKDAAKMAAHMYDLTKETGVSVHAMAYEQIALPVILFRSWMLERQGIKNCWSPGIKLDDDEINDAVWTNESSLDPQYLLRSGFKINEYVIDSGNLVIAARK